MKLLSELNKYRHRGLELKFAGRYGDDYGGIFIIASPISYATIRICASNEGGWDHVSVSIVERTPTWEEMEFVKRLFFHDNETVMQLHPKISDYINIHPNCLHLWRPHDYEIILPPKEYV